MQVINLSDEEIRQWIKLVTPVQQEYIEAMEKLGLNGKEILDTVKLWPTSITPSINSG